MNEYSSSLEKWARSSISKTLVSVVARLYVDGSKIEQLPYHAIHLQFDEGPPGFIDCAPDGSSLFCNSEKLRPIAMGEAGELVLQDVSADKYLGAVVGSRLSKVWIIHSKRDSIDIGVKLRFHNDVEIILANLGDELLVCDAISEELVQDESLVCRPLAL